MRGSWSCIDLLLDEGGTVRKCGTAMSKALTEGHPVPIHEGDAKEIKRKPVVIAEVGRAGAPDLIDPGPDQLPLQAHRDLPFTLPGHFDLEHVEQVNEQAVCPSGCRLLVGNGSTESGIWSEGPLGDLTAPTSGRGKPRNAVGRSRGGGIEQRGCGALLLLLPRLPLRRSNPSSGREPLDAGCYRADHSAYRARRLVPWAGVSCRLARRGRSSVNVGDQGPGRPEEPETGTRRENKGSHNYVSRRAGIRDARCTDRWP